MGDAVDEHIGKRLFDRRRLLNLTQERVASAMGVTFQQIYKYECGASRVSAARLWSLASALDVGVSYFFEGLERRDGGQTRPPGQAAAHSL